MALVADHGTASTNQVRVVKHAVAAVALEDAAQVAILRGPPWRVASRVAVPAGPHNVAANPDGTLFAVTGPPSGAVTLLRTSGAEVRTVEIAGSPHDVVFGADGRTLWITAEQAARLVEVAVSNGSVLRTLPTGGRPHDLDRDPRRNALWVTIDGSSYVEVRDAATGRTSRAPTPAALRTTLRLRRMGGRSGSATGRLVSPPSLLCIATPRGSASSGHGAPPLRLSRPTSSGSPTTARALSSR